MSHIYVLLSEKDRRSYVGSTINLERRVREHNSGKCRSTIHRMPLKLVYSEEFDTISGARQREMYLKTSAGRKELAQIFNKIDL